MSKVATTTEKENEVEQTPEVEVLDQQEDVVVTDGEPEASLSSEEDDISDDELDGRVITPSFFGKSSSSPLDNVNESDQASVDQAELARLRAIESEYLSFTSDPLVEAAYNFRKSGGNDVMAFVNELTGGYKDINKMTMDEMYEANYRNGIAKRYQLSEDDIEEALDDFRMLSAAKKAEIIDPIREKLEQESKNGIKNLSDKFAGNYKEQEEKVQAFEKRERNSVEELDNKLNALVGKTLHRVQVTTEMAKELRESAMKFAIRNPETLEADVDATISMWMWMLNGEKVLKQHIRYGQNRGLEAGVIGRSNGNASPIKTNSASSGNANDKYEQLKQRTGGKLPRVGNSSPNN
jgi:hypothetical protein